MKKIFRKVVILTMACLLTVSSMGFGMLVGCDNGKEENVNYNNMVIANFGDYSSLGVGKLYSELETQTMSVKTMSLGGGKEDKGNIYLVIKKNGAIEKVKFKDENGKETEQKLYVCAFVDLELFTILGFTTENTGAIVTEIRDYNLSDEREFWYVLDNSTGKIFDLEYFRYIHLTMYNNMNYLAKSSRAIYCYAETSERHGGFNYYRLSIQNEEFIIEEIIREDVLREYYPQIVDKYDNIYLSRGDANDSTTDWYIINSEKELIKIEYKSNPGDELYSTMWIGMNGIVYCDIAERTGKEWIYFTQEFNENGQLQTSEFVPEYKEYLSSLNLIKKDGDISYYYPAYFEGTNYGNGYRTVARYEKIDDIKYSVTPIELEGVAEYSNNYNYVVVNDKIYFLENEEIYYCEIETGKKTSVTSDYLFSSISSNNLGEVFFTAIDNKMNTVNGIIYADGTISTEVKENTYDMVVVKPLN